MACSILRRVLNVLTDESRMVFRAMIDVAIQKSLRPALNHFAIRKRKDNV